MIKLLNKELVESHRQYLKRCGNSDENIYALLLEKINFSRALSGKGSHYLPEDSLGAARGQPRNAMPHEKRGIDDSDEKYRFEFISRKQLIKIAKKLGETSNFLFPPKDEKESSGNTWGTPNNKGSYFRLIEQLCPKSKTDFSNILITLKGSGKGRYQEVAKELLDVSTAFDDG